ncbi:DNA (cytosine-5-)-methyltransferase [Pelistega europaea]|uniref:DNA (cytosine-5-)-methyltransferase n=1 Tax=Pelistega europaea TaxID=106147 RepID=A0A7Y4P5N2_9BURK|nr:DNA (cytosine-5-)-methyltransferase [Pelistega europaea]NOL49034.1 DNA (cytosine-5-)-methyltransferase [Pelistega europaea]
MELTVAELFAGVGGFRVGLNHITGHDSEGRAIENGDWAFVWANQYEPSTKVQHAFVCYTKRFGEAHHSNEDINKVDKNAIPNHALLVGGFPCQDYSVARSLANEKGIEGKKGVLFWDIKAVIEAKNPPFVLLENVDRLLKSPSSQRGRDFAIMLKTFDALGYIVHWRMLNAGDYGMPQKRRRVFILAFKKTTRFAQAFDLNTLDLEKDNFFNEVFPISGIAKGNSILLNTYPSVLEVSSFYKDGKFADMGIMQNGVVLQANAIACVEKVYPLSKVIEQASQLQTNAADYAVQEEKLEKWKALKGAKKIERTSSNGHKYVYSEGSMSFPEKMDEPARTMLTSEGTLNRSSHIIFDEQLDKYRILTPLECELIQMFPANWTDTMPARNRYFMMGNALVTGIISRLEPKLKSIIQAE